MRKRAILLILLALFLLSCEPSPKIFNLGDKARDFSLLDLAGQTHSQNELIKGDKEVLLNFWVSWCVECRQEMPYLNEFAAKYKDKLEIVGIDLRESKETVASIVQSDGLKYKIWLDTDGKVGKLYGVTVVPRNILINKDGLIKKLNLDLREMTSYFAQEYR